MLAVSLGVMFPPTAAKADILYNWFGPRYAYRPIFPRRTVVAYTPMVAYSPVATGGCNTCATTTAGYAPYTSYRPVSVSVPVTTYRPQVACNSCGGTTTVLRPVTMYRQQVQYQPVTSYRPVASGCSTCGVQTAAYAAPGCSTCGVASGGCASGNCGVNYGAVTGGYPAASPGCSTCGVSSGASSYTVQPSSNFVPNSTGHTGTHVPSTTSETPTPAITPQSTVPRTQVEPQNIAPEAGTGPTIPMTYRESAVQQPMKPLKPIPNSVESNSDSGSRARPRLVNPQDKTARVNKPTHSVLQAVYSSEAPVLQPVSATTLPQPSAKALKDAQGWGAKR